MKSLLRPAALLWLVLVPCQTTAAERVATVRVPAELGNLAREVMGTVIAEHQQTLAFEVDGRVISASREMGTQLIQGDAIIVLDARAARARLSLALAGAELARADLRLHKAQYQRLSSNHANQAISDADLDAALAKLERAKAGVHQANAQISLSQVDLDKHTITAQFNGALSERSPETGTFLRAGAILGELVNPQRRVRMHITSKELRAVESHQLSIRSRQTRQVLPVIAASPLANIDSGLHPVDLRVPGSQAGKAGELIALELINDTSFQHLHRALRRDQAGEYLWVVENGAAHRVAWPDGASSLPGKSVVVIGGEALTNGSAVEVVALDDPP